MVVDVVISEFSFLLATGISGRSSSELISINIGCYPARAIVRAAVRLVTTLVIEAAIRQMTVFMTAVLPVVKMSSALMDVVVPPVVPLIILHVASIKRIVKNEFLWLMF